MPTATSPTIVPDSSRIGTTVRHESPRLPGYSSTTVPPASASSTVPANGRPIRLVVGCVYRVRSGAITTMKSVSVASRAASAYG